MMMFKQSMRTKCDHWIAFPALVCILFSFLPAQGQNDLSVDDYADIKIHASMIRDIGGYTDVQEVFGIMSGNIDSRSYAYLRDANMQGIRNIINWIPKVDQYGYKFPSWAKGLEPQFADRQASFAWFDEFIQRDPYPLWNNLLNVNYFDGRYGDVSVTLGPRPTLFDGRMERNMEASRKHMDAYIQALKNLIPPGGKSKLRFFQLQNEPNQGRFWAAQFYNNQKKTVESYTRVFNGLYDYLKAKHPDVNFLGTCVGHNGTYRINQYDYTWEEGFDRDTTAKDWNTWVKHFIDQVENPEALAYFNPNSYSIPSLRQLANASMTQNYAEIAKGMRPRYVITETSGGINGTRAEVYNNQFIFHANDIYMMLHHPDKFASRHAFMAAPQSPNQHSFFTNTEERGFTAEAPYWVYRTFQHLRGKVVHYESDNEHIRVFAASPQYDRLVIGLFNPTKQVQPINLDPGVPNDVIEQIIQRKAVFDKAISNAQYTEDELDIGFPYSIELAPESVYAFEIDLSKRLEFDQAFRENTFYGNKVKQGMSNTLTVNIPVSELPADSQQVLLRMGFDKKKALGSYQFELNGKSYEINWGDIPDATIESWNYMSGYVEIPVDNNQISMDNELKLDPLSDNIFLFSSLVYQSAVDTNIYRQPGSNASLDAITWPDAVDSVKLEPGWIGDTLPGFDSKQYSYHVSLPYGTPRIPALVAHPEDLNAHISVDRATAVNGTLEDRTTVFTVTAENDTTNRQYRVVFEEKLPLEKTQPFEAAPIITQLIFRYNWLDDHFLEITNPGNQPIDLSNYLIARGIPEASPDEIIRNFTDSTKYKNRYIKYVPGYLYPSEAEWKANPARLIKHEDFDPVLEGGETFVLGSMPLPLDNVHCDVVFQASDDPSLQAEVVETDGSHPVNHWPSGKTLSIWRILNDSIHEGTKPMNDPDDFRLVDVFGDYAGTYWAPAGVTLEDISIANWNIERKPGYWKGDTLPGVQGSWAENEEASEWTYFNNNSIGVFEGIGGYDFDPVTAYMSKITSYVYHVSDGYQTPQTIKGIQPNTRVTNFYANIHKYDTNQVLNVLGTAGTTKPADAFIEDQDTLKVLSADGKNQTRYVLYIGSLSTDAVLTSSTYSISHSGDTGTISGIPQGTSVKTVLEHITKPEEAVLHLIDGNNDPVPLQRKNFNNTYVDTRAGSYVYFEVIAEDRATEITYQLETDVAANQAYVFSNVYAVDQDLREISMVSRGTNVKTFFKYLHPSQGASIKLKDASGKPRTGGYVAFDDQVVVTSPDASTQKVYQIKGPQRHITYRAYVVSDTLVVDQDKPEIWGIQPELEVDRFYDLLTPAPGASMQVLDESGESVESGKKLRKGLQLEVVSHDDTKTQLYDLYYGKIKPGTRAYVTSDSLVVDSAVTTISEIEPGMEIADFLNLLVPAAKATMRVFDAEGTAVGAGALGEDYTLQVTSGDGSQSVNYDLEFIYYPNTEAYVTSDSLSVDSSTLVITGIQIGMSVAEFKDLVTPAPGSDIAIMDADSHAVDAGILEENYLLEVVSEDSSLTVVYELVFIPKAGNAAYVTSDSLHVDSSQMIISGIQRGMDIAAFKELVTPAPGAKLTVLDEDSSMVDSGDLLESYILKVIAEDGSQEVIYALTFITAVTPAQKTADFQIYPNPATNYVFVKGIKPNTHIMVRNMVGRVVKVIDGQKIQGRGFSVKELPAGLYFIYAQDSNGLAGPVKLIKQ